MASDNAIRRLIYTNLIYLAVGTIWNKSVQWFSSYAQMHTQANIRTNTPVINIIMIHPRLFPLSGVTSDMEYIHPHFFKTVR